MSEANDIGASRESSCGELDLKVEEFVTTFTNYFEEKLLEYGVESEVKGQPKPGKTSNLLAQPSGAAVGGVAGILVTATTGVPGMAKAGSSAGSKVSSLVWNFASGKDHRKKAKIITEVFSQLKKDELRETLVRTAIEIFKNFEWQFVHATDLQGSWRRGLQKLAIDGRNRAMQYIFEMQCNTISILLTVDCVLILKGVLYGKSKDGIVGTLLPKGIKSIIPTKPGFTLKNILNNETWKTTNLYEDVGLLLFDENCEIRKSYRKKGVSAGYGYRLPFDWELEEDLSVLWEEDTGNYSTHYDYILTHSPLENRIQNVLITINKEDHSFMLSKIDVDIQESTDQVEQIKILQDESFATIKSNEELLHKVDKYQYEIKEDIIEIKENTAKLEALVSATIKKENRRKVFNVQHPVKSFTGRIKELSRLFELFKNGNELVMIAVVGLGGIGKSELAKKFVQRSCTDEMLSAVWIKSDTEIELKRSIHSIASLVNIPVVQKRYDNEMIEEERSLAVIMRDIYVALSETRSVFIFDSAESLNCIERFLPLSMPPCLMKPFVLITSRSQNWDIGDEGDIEVINLDVFSREESMSYIKNVLKISDDFTQDDVIWELSEKLQFLPLALQQATSYIREKNTLLKARGKGSYTIQDYLNDFNHQASLRNLLTFRPKHRQDRYIETLYSTWKVSLDHIKNQENGSSALEVIELMAYFASNEIKPDHVFSSIFESEDFLWSSIELLAQYSLVSLVEGIVCVHNLVQTVTRLWLKEESREREVLEKALCHIHYEFDIVNDHFTSIWNYASHYGDLINSFLFNTTRYFDKIYVVGLLVKSGFIEAIKNILECINEDSYESRYLIGWDLFGDVEFMNKILGSPSKATLLEKRKLVLILQASIHSALDTGVSLEISSLIDYMSSQEANAWLEGCSLLYHLVNTGRLDVVQLLMQHTIDINCRNRDNETCLHAAARSINHDIVQLLLDSGADCEARGAMIQTPLHDAVGNGSYENVKSLIKHGAKVESTNVFGWTGAHIAARKGFYEILDYLYEQGANLDTTDISNSTPLLHAARNGHQEIVRFLIEKKVDLNTRDMNGANALHVAVQCSRYEVARSLIESGCDVKAVDNTGKTALHLASESGHLETIKLLMEKGLKPDTPDCNGTTSLHVVAGYRMLPAVYYLSCCGYSDSNPVMEMFENLYFNVVNYFMKMNCKVDVLNNARVTPLHLAIESGDLKIVKILIEKGARITAYDSNGRSVLHKAAERGEVQIFQFFFEKKIQYRFYDDFENTPLHYAARNGCLKIVQYLVLKRKIFDEKNSFRCTALFEAVKRGFLDIVKCLVQNGANVNIRNSFGTSPLNVASENGFFSIVQYLIHNRGDFKKPGAFGKTCLHDAVEGGHIEIVEYLISKGAPLDVCDVFGQTPLLMASKTGFEYLFLLLYEKCNNIKACDVNKRNCLHSASANGHMKIVQYIIEHALIDISKPDCDGDTILHLAAAHGQYEIVQYLLQIEGVNSININAVNYFGATPLILASFKYQLDIVKLLLSRGANIVCPGNLFSACNITPLHILAAFDADQLVQDMMHITEDINTQMFGLITPLDVAYYFHSMKLMEILNNRYLKNFNSNIDELIERFSICYTYVKDKTDFFGFHFWLCSRILPLKYIEIFFGKKKRFKVESMLNCLKNIDAKYLKTS